MWMILSRRARANGGHYKSGRRLGAETLERRLALTGAPTVVDVEVASTQWSSGFYSYLHDSFQGDYGYRVPVGSSSQTKPLPWTAIDKVVLKFSEDVNIQQGDLSISGINVPNVAFSHFFYDAYAHVATWTLAAPLPKNTYQFDLDANGADPVIDLDGNVLDGEWTNGMSAFPSGNGTAGGDFAFLFKVLPGDVDQSGTVNTADYNDEYWRIPSSPGNTKYRVQNDLDGNATINSTDLQKILSNWNTTSPSGTPVGVSNDAPTTRGIQPTNITNMTADVVFSLYTAFDDAETPDSSLQFQVVSNSNPGLFDYVALNSQSGQLSVNAKAGTSGVSRIVVAATDAQGQRVETTFEVGVNYINVAPSIDFEVVSVGQDTWLVSGIVTDDQPVEGLIVYFQGAFDARATVKADGTFTFAVIVPEMNWGWEHAHTFDRWGLVSNYDDELVDLT